MNAAQRLTTGKRERQGRPQGSGGSVAVAGKYAHPASVKWLKTGLFVQYVLRYPACMRELRQPDAYIPAADEIKSFDINILVAEWL